MCACRSTNLSKKEQKTSEELKHIEDIVMRNANIRGTRVILHVKDYIKESERELMQKNY